MTKTTALADRRLLKISGKDATEFLQNLITCDVENLHHDGLTFGALLSPQGKILFDFFLLRQEESYTLDVSQDRAQELQKRLTFYKLRADVTIEVDETRNVYVVWPVPELYEGPLDPRFHALGGRVYAQSLETNASEEDWNTHRLTIGMPQSGLDFVLGEKFPHDVLMDQFSNSGVDFTKGCYVGQEVVSRMQHRGTARNRIVKISAEEALPEVGTELLANGKVIGQMGSHAGNIGLASVRVDRVKTAMNSQIAITADNIVLQLQVQDFSKVRLEDG